MNILKKTVKWFGNFLMLFGIYFIFKKLIELDIDYTIVFEGHNLFILIILSLIYGFNVCFLTIPWRNYVYLVTKYKVAFKDICFIYTKSNIMKYIPGNVFQYIGRNEIAIKNDLKHKDIAISTVLEILSLSFAALLCALIFNTKGLIIWLSEYNINYIYFLIIFIVIICLCILIIYKFNNKMQSMFATKLKQLLTKKNIYVVLKSLFVDILVHIVYSTVFILILVNIVNTEIIITDIPMVMGAYLISWLVGYVTIGSPGGIGVRELVICLLLDGMIAEENVLLAIILFRVVSIVGDMLALIFATALKKCSKV